MTGWLVVNAFTASRKFIELYAQLEKAAADQGVVLRRIGTIEASAWVAHGPSHSTVPDFVLFWDKDVRLCRALELVGCRCLNSSRAIELCDDKAATYLELLEAGLPQPRAMLVPKAFHAPDWSQTSFPHRVASELGLPVVAKECHGSFGAQVHLARDEAELANILSAMQGRPALCQEFVQESKGHDVRLQVVGNKVVAAMERLSASDDFRANVTNGAMARLWEPTEAQSNLALAACRVLGLDFAGVDLLFGKKDEPLVCEVNSNAHFVNLSRASGVDVAYHIVRHALASRGGA
ncbi:MAG: RimK family alpha-L-glutamate ligase [Atopobiaceae bacterium]|nr:RimK family alpha-L-glutamate ligase [Atopobiaceae bacterium]